ncbi:MAG: LamG domain-containing protein, partial [bacterium]
RIYLRAANGLLLFLFSANSVFSSNAAGGALRFDGTTDYVVLSETTAMMGPGWEDEKTVSLWVRPLGLAQDCTDPAHCDAIFGDRPRWWGISRGVIGGKDKIWIWNYDGNYDLVATDYVPNKWTHIAMVHSDGVLTAFKDGREVGTVPSGTTVQPSTGAFPVLHLGGIINAVNRNFTCHLEMDEVAIWSVGLSAGQIARDVYRTLDGNEEDLDAYYKMSDGSGNQLSDDSVNNWDGMLEDGGRGVEPDGQCPLWVESAVPLIDPEEDVSSFYFPQFADGTFGALQFQSTLVLVNTGDSTSGVKIELFSTPDGMPMELPLGDLGTASVFDFGLQKGGSVSLSTPGTGDVQVGYARVVAGKNVGGVVVFSRTDLTTGVSLYEAGVPAAKELSEFSIFIDSLGARDTGFAIVYPPEEEGASAAAMEDGLVTIRLYDKHYQLLGEKTLPPLSPGSHLARYVHQMFDDPGIINQAVEMQGILVFESDQPLVAVTVRQTDHPDKEFPLEVPILTTFPVIPGAPLE